MRTIVALFVVAIASGQTPAEIERLENHVAQHPDSAPDRQAFLKALTTTDGVPLDQLRAARRALILWLIERQPESKMFDEAATLLWMRGRMGDPQAFAQASELWKAQASKPEASAKTIANAALFFRAANPLQGIAILDAAAENHSGDPDLARARGILNALVMLGVSGIGEDNNRIRLVTNEAKRAAKAVQARGVMEASQDAHVIGAAGEFLTRNGVFDIPYDLTIGDDDVPSLAERWLRRARELSPPGDEWNTPLATAIHQRAQRTKDPAEKLRLLNESSSLSDRLKTTVRAEIAEAEFALGDDAAASRDARPLIDAPRNSGEHSIGETLLGRIALARSDASEAKQHLLASLHPPGKLMNAAFQPRWDLAQDFYDTGDHDAVIEYLEASREVWKSEHGRIDRMIGFVRKAPSVDLAQLSRQLPGGEILRHSAPAFEATGPDGKIWTRELLAGKVVALEFGSAPLVEKIAKDFSARGLLLLQIRDDDVKRRFEVLTDPTVIVIDRQGKVSAFRSGETNEAELRRDFETASSAVETPVSLPAPRLSEAMEGEHGKIALAWEPVDTAESYVVEWDSRDEQGWIFDRDRTVRVIPTRDPSAVLDLTGFTRVRWRVYAVPKSGPPGKPSPWREIEGMPVTKIYK
jgi:hypothetical protein